MISLLTYSAISALDDHASLACVAGAKMGGGGRKARKRGKSLPLSNPPPSFRPPYPLPSRRLLRRLELMYPGCQRLFMRGFQLLAEDVSSCGRMKLLVVPLVPRVELMCYCYLTTL